MSLARIQEQKHRIILIVKITFINRENSTLYPVVVHLRHILPHLVKFLPKYPIQETLNTV
jgi:hypothetical protein